jgi:hypothetical protein
MFARTSRALPMLALAVLLVAPAEAQKRRAVRSAPPSTSPPQGACHTFNFVRAGLKASYQTTQPSGNASFTITYLSDNATQTRTSQTVTTSQGTATAETVIDTEVFGNLRGVRRMNVKGSQAVPILGSVSFETDITFAPSLVYGPSAGWCAGNTWTVSPVTETIVSSTSAGAIPPQIVTTLGATGEVLAVGEPVTAAGRTINTVKYRGAIVSGTSVQTAITWMSMADNIVVKQDALDGNGAVTSTTILTALQ